MEIIPHGVKNTLTFTPTNRRNGSCPVCDDIKGKCRTTNTELVFCMEWRESLNGWQFIGESSGGIWGRFLPASGITEQRKPVKPESVKAEVQPEKKIVSDDRKHEAFQLLTYQIDLDDRHIADFRRRGLSDAEIEYLSGFARSVGDGYLIPFQNVRGQFTGCQKRRDKADDTGRYRWYYLRHDWSLDNQFNEKPLAVWGNSGPVWLIEGTGVKPAVASFRHGITAIGAAGGMHHTSPKTLADTLKALGNPQRVILCPDAGDVVNRHVTRRIARNLETLEGMGLEVSIAWWGQDTKNKPDIDELPNLEAVRYLSPEEFWELVPEEFKAEGTIENANPIAAVPDPAWIKAEAKKQRDRNRAFTATTTINDRYLPPLPAGDIAVKSGMGTGKTQQIKALSNTHDRGVILLGSRNSLLIQTIARLNEGVEPLKQFLHIHDDEQKISLQDPYGRAALCLDSLDKFENLQWFDGKLLILDESVSTVKHLLIGETLKHRRGKVLRLFDEAVKRACSVVCLDGNQNNTIAGYVEKLRGKAFQRILNKAQAAKLNVTITNPAKARDYSPVIAKAGESLANGENIAFLSDSQRLCEAVDTLWTQAGYRTFRVDSKTMSDREIKAIVADPRFGTWLKSQGIQALILSPSAESGLDVTTTGYFSRGFAVYLGILDTDTQMQHLRRVREIREYLVHCPLYATLKTDGKRSIFTGGMARHIAEAIELELSNFAGVDISAILEGLKHCPHLEATAKLQASRNYEYAYTREALSQALEDNGHLVSMLDTEECAEVSAIVQGIKKALVRQDAERIFNAKPINIELALRIKQSFSATLEQRWEAERAILLDRLPGIEWTNLWTVELVEKLLFTDRHYLDRLENFWMLSHIDLAEARSRKRVEDALQGEIHWGDVGLKLAKLRYFESLGVLGMIDRPVGDAEILPLWNRARDKRGTAAKLGLSPGKAKPNLWFSKILAEQFGIRSHRKRGETTVTFTGPQEDPLYQFVSSRCESKLAEFSIEKPPETVTGQGLEPCRYPSNDITNESMGICNTQTFPQQGLEHDRDEEISHPSLDFLNHRLTIALDGEYMEEAEQLMALMDRLYPPPVQTAA